MSQACLRENGTQTRHNRDNKAHLPRNCLNEQVIEITSVGIVPVPRPQDQEKGVVVAKQFSWIAFGTRFALSCACKE